MHGLIDDVDVEITPMSPFMHGIEVVHTVCYIFMSSRRREVRHGDGLCVIVIDPVSHVIEETYYVLWPC